MLKRSASTVFALSAMTLGLGNSASVFGQPGCDPVQGKITNTFIAQDGSRTLGVVALVYGPKRSAVKLKCALVGQERQDLLPPGGDIAFIHTISCDDTTNTALGPLHSSIWLYTTGNIAAPDPRVPGQVATFEETSIPLPGGPSPTGIFDGAINTSQLFVQGAIYATGSIDMTFQGQICRQE